MNYGTEVGETCHREGCAGIIEQNEADGSCKCHINPPCSHCTTSREYCPECDWDAEDERIAKEKEYCERNKDLYKNQHEAWEKRRSEFWAKYNSPDVADKFDWIDEAHTHFSMKKIGIFPPKEMSLIEVLDKIKGTFGGRFEYFDKVRGRFRYIAYTD